MPDGVPQSSPESARHSEQPPAADGRLGVLVQIGLLAGPLLSMIDSSVVNVAIASIARDLQSPLATVQWAVSSYLLALAAALAASPFLVKRFGNQRVYVASLVAFTLASAGCALAPTLGVLVGLRILQGIGGAPLVPVAMNLLLGGEGAHRRVSPAAGMLLFLAPALGPTLGGLLIPSFGWQAIFLINVPVGLLGVAGALRLPGWARAAADPAARFDLFGFLLLAAGVSLALYGASEGPQDGWLAPTVWPFWAAGAGLLIAYAVWERRSPRPAVDLGPLRDRNGLVILLLSALASVVMFAVLFLVPIFMQSVQRQSALAAGLTLLPQGLVTGLGTILGSWFAARYGARLSAATGMLVLAATTAVLLAVDAATPPWLIALILSGRGLALGLTIQPLLLALTGGLAPAAAADANTLFNIVERLAGSFGIALLATFFQVREQARVGEVLHALGIDPALLSNGLGGVSGAASGIPPSVQARLGEAATAGFHDIVLALVAASVIGIGIGLLLRERHSAVDAPTVSS